MLKKCGILLLTGLVMLLGCPLYSTAASAASAGAVLYDLNGVLDGTEYTQCQIRLEQAADYVNMNISVVLGTDECTDGMIESLADSTYDALFGKGTDGLLYYMDLKGYEPYDYISTSGMGQFYYTNVSSNNRIEAIFSDLDSYLYPVGSEDVYGAVMRFAELTEYYYDLGVPDQYYYYDDVYDKYYHLDEYGNIAETSRKPYVDWGEVVIVVFVSFCIGLIAALIVFFAVKARYRFKSSLSPTTYVNRKMVQFNQQYDRFVRAYTQKVHVDSGGGSSGGGGGGHSSGGHGGGGHHR